MAFVRVNLGAVTREEMLEVTEAPARFVLIGNPASRRIAHFANTLAVAGYSDIRLVSWLELARHGTGALERISDAPAFVRIDSFGEDVDVARALLRRGLERAESLRSPTILRSAAIDALSVDAGRIVAPRQVHEGFLAVLDDLERVVRSRPAWRLFTPIDAIRAMFDKRETSRAMASLGIPVARSLSVPGTASELRSAMKKDGIDAAWIKLACGSSASCLALWELRDPSDVLITTMERTDRGLFNSKRVRRYSRPRDIAHLVDFILCEGAHVEADVPKAVWRDRWIDCRVVSLLGDQERIVVRASRYPMTNLHLGASRHDVEAIEGRCAPHVIAAARESCRRIRRHYRAVHVGVDVAFTRNFEEHVVLEANAFGDFLHGSTLGESSVYADEIRSLYLAS